MNCTGKQTIPVECRWARHIFHMNTPLGADGTNLTGSAEHIALSRKIAAEGTVLLENDGILPLKPYTKSALFGVGSIDYIKGGTGSGAVHCRYVGNLYEGFAQKGDRFPVFSELEEYYYNCCVRHFESLESDDSQYFDRMIKEIVPEPDIPEDLVKRAADYADVAIISIHRSSGESFDRTAEKGDYYLSDAETRLIELVTKYFDKCVVVLNNSGMMDVRWIKNTPAIRAALLAWQGGMEGAYAIADILCGDVNPSGKLTDTFAGDYTDYPSCDCFDESEDYVNYYEDIYVGYRYFETVPGAKDKVIYPFGYGLSYTTFDIGKPIVRIDRDTVNVSVRVKNTGKVPGKEVVQIYFSAPQGKLGKPAVQLAAYKKTALLAPGMFETVYLSFPASDMASFDDLGKCCKSAYVLEQGDYRIFAGQNCESLIEADSVYTVCEEYRVVQQLTSLCAPNKITKRMLATGEFEELPSLPIEKYFPDIPEITDKAPEREQPYTLSDVANGTVTLDQFIAQMSVDELIYLTGGHECEGVCNTGRFAGMAKYGIIGAKTADGPQGVRILPEIGIATTAWPCATMLACTWNPALAAKIGEAGALEMKENSLAVWLTPALNIHRNPLCGRNFEYYSEDPLISGTIAAAEVNGIQSQNIAGCPKHFACNNREVNRMQSDSRLSERALREIYLRGFEICVKTSHPWTIMTGYNIINARRCCESYELLALILRGEWGFDGMVTTDWGVPCHMPDLVKAGNDIRMWEGMPEDLKKAYDDKEITRGQLEETARHILTLLLRLE